MPLAGATTHSWIINVLDPPVSFGPPMLFAPLVPRNAGERPAWARYRPEGPAGKTETRYVGNARAGLRVLGRKARAYSASVKN